MTRMLMVIFCVICVGFVSSLIIYFVLSTQTDLSKLPRTTLSGHVEDPKRDGTVVDEGYLIFVSTGKATMTKFGNVIIGTISGVTRASNGSQRKITIIVQAKINDGANVFSGILKQINPALGTNLALPDSGMTYIFPKNSIWRVSFMLDQYKPNDTRIDTKLDYSKIYNSLIDSGKVDNLALKRFIESGMGNNYDKLIYPFSLSKVQ